MHGGHLGIHPRIENNRIFPVTHTSKKNGQPRSNLTIIFRRGGKMLLALGWVALAGAVAAWSVAAMVPHKLVGVY